MKIMNPTVKENTNDQKARELAEVILKESVSNQNEIFDMIRRIIVNARMELVIRLRDEANKITEESAYAESSLKSNVIDELK